MVVVEKQQLTTYHFRFIVHNSEHSSLFPTDIKENSVCSASKCVGHISSVNVATDYN